MAMYKLSATRINKIIRQGKKGKYGDGGNLWLEVAGVDVASWLFRWKDRITKKDRSISYGPWHITDLARRLDEQIKRGLARTVRQVVDEFDRDIISHNARNTQIGTRRRMRIVNRTIGDMPFAKVTRQIILDDAGLGLSKLWVEKHPTGKHLQSETAQLFVYGIDKAYKRHGYNPQLWA